MFWRFCFKIRTSRCCPDSIWCLVRGWTGGGGGTGIEGAESGVEGAESGVKGAGSGSRGGGKRGNCGRGSGKIGGRKCYFLLDNS